MRTDGRIDATRILAPERANLLDLLRGMAPEDWARPTECPEWDVKGIVLHILGDDLSLLSRQRDGALDGITLYAETHAGMDFRSLLDGFNEQWVHAARFMGAPLILDLLASVGEWSDRFYCEIGLDTIAREPVGFFASAEPSPYWQLIAREYAERIIHQSQIRRAIGAPELEGELMTWMARVVTHALSVWIGGYEAAQGATIAIEWGSAGSWTWCREDSGWSVHEGTDAASTARVSVPNDRVVALLTRGVTVDEATELLELSGDTSLVAGALAIATPLLANP